MMTRYSGWLVAATIVLLAMTGNPNCPSDIDDDGTVSTSDLLQLLGDWGPCAAPEPRLVDLATRLDGADFFTYRLWSTGLVERFKVIAGGCTFLDHCGGSGWIALPLGDVQPDAEAVALSIEASLIHRAWSNGVIDVSQVTGSACLPSLCGDWQQLPQ